MAELGTSAGSAAATKCTEILVDKVVKELSYLCCYKSYAVDFEEKKGDLKAAVERVEMKLRDAKTRNETQIDPLVKCCIDKANKLIHQEATPRKWFGFCTDCFSRCSLAKQMDSWMREIPTIMETLESFSQVAHAAERPGMEFYSQEFLNFKSRNVIYEQLMEELKDDQKCRIGLHAMGGSGKTTMAKAIGKEVENSKVFDKVVFIEVPNPVDENKIRDEIEKKLELKLEDDQKKNLTHAEQIWIRIANAGNVLIILDDVWKELNLENIGIHHGKHNKGRCCVLLTTRYGEVCTGMGCQKPIKLEVLAEEDAVDLFLYHASESGNNCPNKLKVLASQVVNKCGNLPVIVVALARTFRKWDPKVWEDAFVAIERDLSLRHGSNDVEAEKFYNSLKISFNCLDAGAQDIMLLCSIFPRAYEIPIELLSRIAIGLGICQNGDSYYRARSHVLLINTGIISSALLLTGREGFVKMHDEIRRVAQQIGDDKVQVMEDFETKLKENVKYLSWIINDFSHYFEGSNLEVLLVWVTANGSLEVPDALFGGMKGLRVLLLCSKVKFGRTLASSLPKSIHSLENIQTLSLTNWDLGDISILRSLKTLQTLELTNCSIIELPNDISQLEKLRLLHLERCSIKRNNPFEVIGRCSKLEVLYYVSNSDAVDINANSSKISILQEFGIYHIEGGSSERYFELDASVKRYFNSTKLKGIFCERTIKSLATRAEILELTECNETRWTNLIPDMVHPMKDEGFNNLVKLSLDSWPSIQCLLCTNGIQSNATIFSNLVELQLHDMRVKEICRGDFPNEFFKQLEKLDLSLCTELDGTLFKGKLDLSNLKFVEVTNCSMTCLFHLSVVQSLKQLGNLCIRKCSKLKCLISDYDRSSKHKMDDHQYPSQEIHRSMFPNLKILKVEECNELEFVLPIFPCKELESVKVDDCKELKYIFGQCLEEEGLYQMEKEIILPLLQELKIANVPKFISIYPEYNIPQHSQAKKSRGPLCCLFPKASSLSLDEASVSKPNQLDRTQASKERLLNKVGGLFTTPLYPNKILRKMIIEGFSELKFLFTESIASSLMLLEILKVKKCDALECILTDQGPDSHGHVNAHSIFPNLQQVHVYNCDNLEYVFPAFYLNDLKNLEFVRIWGANKMKYVFGKCRADQNHNVQIELDLPALKKLSLGDVTNMVSICTKNYSVKALSLQDISLKNCPQLPINSVMDLSVEVPKREGDRSRRKASKAKSVPSTPDRYSPRQLYQLIQSNLREISITGFSELKSLFTISIASSLKMLETLEVYECDALEHIITEEGPDSHGHMTVHSIFPNLKEVYVRSCNNLEYVFPACCSNDFKDLERVSIWKAEKMKYVFGKCPADHERNIQSKINLPALKGLSLQHVPNMVGICAKNHYVEALYLEYIYFYECPQLPQPFIDFLVGGRKRQEDLSRRKALSFKEKAKSLSNSQELPDIRDIRVGPKTVSSFRNLSGLSFVGCKQLKFILSASSTSSMPELRKLYISDCEELVSVIEDDEENQQNPLDPHLACFPKLHIIQVKHCKNLKSLFSISPCPKLPKLLILEIEDAIELAQLFEWKQSAPQELVMRDVFQNLLGIRLVNLPSLNTIYHEIDFQTVKIILVRDCSNIPPTDVSSSELFDLYRSGLNEMMNFVDDDHFYVKNIIFRWADERKREEREEKSKEALGRDKTISEQNNSTPDLADIEEAPRETVQITSTIQKHQSSVPNLTEIEEEESQEDIGKDSTLLPKNNGSPDFENNTETSTHKVVEELPTSNTTAIPSSKSDRDNLVHKASSSTHSELTISNLDTSASTKELCENESKGDQEALEEGTDLNECPTIDLFTKETTRKVEFTIPPNAEMASPQDPSIATPKKIQIATSDAHTKSKSLQLDLFDISTTAECPQEICEKEPTNESSFKETSNEIALINPPVMTCPISSISSPKKSQTPSLAIHGEIKSGSSAITDQSAQEPSIFSTPMTPYAETSTVHTEPKSSQSGLCDISITTECPKIEEEGSHNIRNDSTIPQQTGGSPLYCKEELNEIAKKELTTHIHNNSDLNNFIGCTNASVHEVVEEKPRTTLSSNSDLNLKQTLGGINETPQRVEEPSRKCPSKESTIPPSMNSTMNTETSSHEIVEEQLSTSNIEATPSSKSDKDNLVHKASSSIHSEPAISNIGTSASTEELCEKASKDDQTAKEMNCPMEPSTFPTPKKPQIETLTAHTEPKSSQSCLSDISISTECPQNLKQTLGGIIEAPQRVEEPTSECPSKEFIIPPSISGMNSPMISSPKKPEIAASAVHLEMERRSSASTVQPAQDQIIIRKREHSNEDDLIRLFRIMKDGSDLEADHTCIAKNAAFEDSNVAKAFADIESTLKMNLNQIANSQEHTHRLEKALNFLSTHVSGDGSSSHGLIVRCKIDSLHKEIQRILSSFKQASETLDTFTKLKETEKWIDEQHSQRMEAATVLVSEICNTESYMNELKDQISILKAELTRKEKEFGDCEIKLSSIHKRKKETGLETIRFMEEYEAVKKDKSYVGDDQTKASQELEKLENQWPTCMAELRKNELLMRILLNQRP